MNRLVENVFTFTSTGTDSWTAPAGVTQIYLTITNPTSFTSRVGFTVTLDVIPNTTYSIVINSTSQLLSSTVNTFGSFQWSSGSRLVIRWVE